MSNLLRDGWPTFLLRLAFLLALIYGEYRIINSFKKDNDISLAKIIGAIFMGVLILVMFMGLFSPSSGGGGHRFDYDDTDGDPQWGR